MNLKALECRVKPIKLTNYKIEELGNNTVKTKKKKDYDYYICDYCKEKIILSKKIEDRTGGIVEIPIDSYKRLNLALCNKCLKPVLELINKAYGTNFLM